MKMTTSQIENLLNEEESDDARVKMLRELVADLLAALKEAQGQLAAAAARAIPAPVVNVAAKGPDVHVAPAAVNVQPAAPTAAPAAKPCAWTCVVAKRDRDGRPEIYRMEPCK